MKLKYFKIVEALLLLYMNIARDDALTKEPSQNGMHRKL